MTYKIMKYKIQRWMGRNWRRHFIDAVMRLDYVTANYVCIKAGKKSDFMLTTVEKNRLASCVGKGGDIDLIRLFSRFDEDLFSSTLGYAILANRTNVAGWVIESFEHTRFNPYSIVLNDDNIEMAEYLYSDKGIGPARNYDFRRMYYILLKAKEDYNNGTCMRYSDDGITWRVAPGYDRIVDLFESLIPLYPELPFNRSNGEHLELTFCTCGE